VVSAAEGGQMKPSFDDCGLTKAELRAVLKAADLLVGANLGYALVAFPADGGSGSIFSNIAPVDAVWAVEAVLKAARGGDKGVITNPRFARKPGE
jgi:hypothetical protein